MTIEQEFKRMILAKRGTIRFEQGDYVILVHCSSYTTYEICRIDHTTYYANIYKDDTLVARNDFNSTLTYSELMAWLNPFIT